MEAWDHKGGDDVQIARLWQESGWVPAENMYSVTSEYMFSFLLIQIIHDGFILIQEWALRATLGSRA